MMQNRDNRLYKEQQRAVAKHVDHFKSEDSKLKKYINPYIHNRGLFRDYYIYEAIKRDLENCFGLVNEDEVAIEQLWNKVKSLWDEVCETSDPNNWSEDETAHKWINPLLDLMGWNVKLSKTQKSISVKSSDGKSKSYIPDFILSDTSDNAKLFDRAYKKNDLDRIKRYSFLPLELKYWNKITELESTRKSKRTERKQEGRGWTPKQQINKYIDILSCDWGILTDGAKWRLYSNAFKDISDDRHFEVNLYNILLASDSDEEAYAHFRYFYYFFSKIGFVQLVGDKPVVDHVYKKAQSYIDTLEDNLKFRFFNSVNLMCNGFLKANDQQSFPEVLKETIQSVSETHLFHMIFIMYCESRSILPLFRSGKEYYKYSLTKIRDELEEAKYDPDYSEDWTMPYPENGTELYDHLMRLYNIVHKGSRYDQGFQVYGFRESLFNNGERKFIKQNKIKNKDMSAVLFNLLFIFDKDEDRYIPTAYNLVTPDQLGSIYEGFLEFKLDIAPSNMIWNSKKGKSKWEEVTNFENINYKKHMHLKDAPRIYQGQYFLTPDNKDRKATGSYYTPDYIVKYIVEKTVSPVCDEKIKTAKKTGKSTAEALLEIRVCDPAMGSAHFLNGALDYLTERYTEALQEDSIENIDIKEMEIKRIILDACIFGVDINPRAVKLAKLALWLNSAYKGIKLEHLDDQLKSGNSLIEDENVIENAFQWREEFEDKHKIFLNGGFDAVLSNPPYIFARNKKLSSCEKTYFSDNYKWTGYQANTYGLFVELAYKITRESGYLGHIVPNNWMTIKSCENLRQSYIGLLSNHLIINCKDKVFADAAVDNSIMVSQKSTCPNNEINLCVLEDGSFIDRGLTEYESGPLNFGVIGCSDFENQSILDSCPTLGESHLVKCGLKAYQIGKGKPTQDSEIKNMRVFHTKTKLSKDHVPYLQGKDVCRYKLEMSKEFLFYGPHLAEPRKFDLFTGHRVLVRQIPSKPPYCIQSVYTSETLLNDINSMIIPAESKEDGIFIMCILNSKVISDWFILKFDKFQRKTFPQFKVNELKQFPIPKVDAQTKSKVANFGQILLEMYASNRTISDIIKIETELEMLIKYHFGVEQEELEMAS